MCATMKVSKLNLWLFIWCVLGLSEKKKLTFSQDLIPSLLDSVQMLLLLSHWFSGRGAVDMLHFHIGSLFKHIKSAQRTVIF